MLLVVHVIMMGVMEIEGQLIFFVPEDIHIHYTKVSFFELSLFPVSVQIFS